MNDSSPSVHGGAVEVELGGGGADQVQHLVIIMMLKAHGCQDGKQVRDLHLHLQLSTRGTESLFLSK